MDAKASGSLIVITMDGCYGSALLMSSSKTDKFNETHYGLTIVRCRAYYLSPEEDENGTEEGDVQ